MARSTGNQARLLVDKEGSAYAVIDSTGQIHRGTVVDKAIFCGKHCRGCPHGYYRYVVYRQEKRTRWLYVGRIEKETPCPQIPKSS